MSKGNMLILRGNSGSYPDEAGKKKNYEHGALHEGAAIHFARLRDYDVNDGDLLEVPGQSAEQISEAVKRFTEKDSTYHALFGFSGGGYHVRRILDLLPPEALRRVHLVIVLGAPPTQPRLDSLGNRVTDASGKIIYDDCEVDGNFKLTGKDKKNTKCGPLMPEFMPDRFAAKYPDHGDPKKTIWWDLIYYTNPDPRGHMFGPDWLLAQELKNRPEFKPSSGGERVVPD